MAKDIFLVVNSAGRNIKIEDFWKKYLPKFDSYQVTRSLKFQNVGEDEHTNIKPSEFTERWKEIHAIQGIFYKWVSLPEDGKNGVELSKEEVDANAGFVISMGRNNKLVKEPVSKEEIKSSGKKKESEEELKDRIISIVKNRSDAATSRLPSGERAHLGQSEQQNASASPSQGRQNNASAYLPQKGKGITSTIGNGMLYWRSS